MLPFRIDIALPRTKIEKSDIIFLKVFETLIESRRSTAIENV